ncbi:hypothetical protein CL658_02930 [bacterium]|nr:hypothetical protein [bacterium]
MKRIVAYPFFVGNYSSIGMFIFYVMMVGLIMLENIWNFANHKQVGSSSHNHDRKCDLANHSFSDMFQKESSDTREFYSPPLSDYGFQFAYSSISDQDIPQLLKQFLQSTPQQALLLAHNHITDQGFMELVAFLKENTTIKHLILSHNALSFNEFAKAGLADLLKVNRFIGWLVFNHNDISDLGAKHLGLALAHNKSVKHLVLSHNYITDRGLTDLLAGLNHHPTLESLFLANNQLSLEALPLLMTFVAQQSCLKRLDISGQFDPFDPLLIDLKKQCELKGIRLHY